MLYAYVAATLLSGAPSTIHALLTGTDPLEATWAAGAMLLPAGAAKPQLFTAAAVVHMAVSAFWTLAFVAMLPRRHVAVWATIASVAVALLDLKVMAPLFFPEVAALPFGPQLADHLMWGGCLGLTLQFLQDRPQGGPPSSTPS